MKVLDKSLWGSEDGLTVVNKKSSADMTSASEINDIEVLNQILMASNYEPLIEEAYYIVEEGWQDDISKLKGLHHTIIEGKLVPSFSQCRGLYVQHQNDADNSIQHIERHCKSLGINMVKQNTRKHLQEGEEIINGQFKVLETVNLAQAVDKEAANIIKENIAQRNSSYVLRPTIRAITAGKTGNNHRFLSRYLQGDPDAKPYPSGIYSYTKPYPKPMLLNHDTYFGEPLGRITLAQYQINEKIGGAVYIYPEIVNQDAITKILDNRYLTVSVGATTDKITCNICGQEFMQEGFCEHDRFVSYEEVECFRIDGACNICGAEGNCEHKVGQVYDNVEAEWFLGQIWFDECSFVNVPADAEAQVLNPGTQQKNEIDVQPMEAYLGFDNELYNINDDSIQSQQKLFGMSIKNFKEGGLDIMGEVNETLDLQSTIDALVAEKDQLATELASLQTKLEEEQATLTSKVNELNEEKETIKAEKDQAIADMLLEKEALQAKLDELAVEKETLSETNITLAAEAHNQLVERVADVKFILNQELDKEEELKSLKSKDKEELQELLKGVMKKISQYNFSAQTVDNPGGSQEEDFKPMSDEEIAEQMVINLFKGDFKPINNKRSEQ